MVAWWVMDPPVKVKVPIIVTRYVPGLVEEKEQDMGVEPPAVRVTLAGQVVTKIFTKLNVAIEVRVRVVFVAVTVTAKVPAVVELHDNVAVAAGGTVTLAGLMVPHVRPAGTLADNETVFVPVPLFIDRIEIVDVAESPILAAGGEVAVTLKSD